MIIVEFYDGQGLGNQLWVYCAGRSIAEELNMSFGLIGFEKFKGRSFLDLNDDLSVPKKFIINPKLEKYEIFNEDLFFDERINYYSSDFDKRVLELKGNIKLNGLFQSEKYFFGKKDRPRKYLSLKFQNSNIMHIDSDVCLLNVRGGEYKNHKKLILPYSYWQDAIINMRNHYNVNKFVIVTDDYKYAKALFPEYKVISNSIENCYKALHAAKFLIVSNSSFSYFPIKTACDEKIVIAPQYWARFSCDLPIWASPANLYTSWLWQKRNGKLVSYDECLPECITVSNHYNDTFLIKINGEYLKTKKFKDFFSKKTKNKIRRILSHIFPKSFG